AVPMMTARLKDLEAQIRGLERIQQSLPPADTDLPQPEGYHADARVQEIAADYLTAGRVGALKESDLVATFDWYEQITHHNMFLVWEPLARPIQGAAHAVTNWITGNNPKADRTNALKNFEIKQAVKKMWDLRTQASAAQESSTQAQLVEQANKLRFDR